MRDRKRNLPEEKVVHEVLGIIRLNSKNDLYHDELRCCNPNHCHTITLNDGKVLVSTGHTHKQSIFNLRNQIIRHLGDKLVLSATEDQEGIRKLVATSQTPLTAYYYAQQSKELQ